MSQTQQHLIGVDDTLSAEQLARLCGAQLHWVSELVQVGIIRVHNIDAPVPQWQLDSTALRRARAVQRLQRELEANLDAVALILDLEDEIRRLKTLLMTAQRAGPMLDVG